MPQLNSNKQKRIYLDYAATTPLDKEALDAMIPYLSDDFGNASTLYEEGKISRKAVNESREKIASLLDCTDPYEIVFTSGGTESNNMAIFGIATAAKNSKGASHVKTSKSSKTDTSRKPAKTEKDAEAKNGKPKQTLSYGHVICSAFEHHSVLDAVAHLKSLNFDVSFISPRKDGFVYPEDLEALIREDTILISIMTANNEIGTIQPISELVNVAHSHETYFHTDATGALGKMELSIFELGIDALSFSSHKVYGPKGVGALYLSKKAPFVPLVYGGGQEKGRRSGTYDVASIVGMAKALELNLSGSLSKELDYIMSLRNLLISRLKQISVVSLVCDFDLDERAKHLASFVPIIVDGFESEDLIRILDKQGFSLSGGSACTSTLPTTSHVLKSIGIDANKSQGFLRCTLGKHTTQNDVEAFALALKKIVCG